MSADVDSLIDRLQAEGAAAGLIAGAELSDELGERSRLFQERLEAQTRGDVEHEAHRIRVRREAERLVAAEAEGAVDLDSLFLDRDALKNLSVPRALIASTLPRNAYGILRGRDQSFKSFVAIDWALTIATGRLWDGLPTETARVLYIAGEGAWGLAGRVAAWEASRQTSVPAAQMTVRQAALNLHRPGAAFEHLLEHVKQRGYGLVVVDTLRRVAGGADGNSSEMGAVVDNLDRIKQATADGTVLVVAHTDKGDNDSRGYSGIEDDADFVWHARRDEMLLELELVKMKDGPDGRKVQLQAQPCEGSLVLFPAAADAAQARDDGQLTRSAEALLDTMRTLFPKGAFTTPLKEAAAPSISKATYHRAIKLLEKRGLVTNEGSETKPFWVPGGLTGSQGESQPKLPVFPGSLTGVSPASQEVSPVSRPLGSETAETETLTEVSEGPVGSMPSDAGAVS